MFYTFAPVITIFIIILLFFEEVYKFAVFSLAEYIELRSRRHQTGESSKTRAADEAEENLT